jgi:hypothetical protein
MRVNIYAEEMTDKIEIISKTIDGQDFTGLRFWLHLPVTLPSGDQVSGPFIHHLGDDDSSAVTFWGKQGLHALLRKALKALDEHYCGGWEEMMRDALQYLVTQHEEFTACYTPPPELENVFAEIGEVAQRAAAVLRKLDAAEEGEDA